MMMLNYPSRSKSTPTLASNGQSFPHQYILEYSCGRKTLHAKLKPIIFLKTGKDII